MAAFDLHEPSGSGGRLSSALGQNAEMDQEPADAGLHQREPGAVDRSAAAELAAEIRHLPEVRRARGIGAGSAERPDDGDGRREGLECGERAAIEIAVSRMPHGGEGQILKR